MTITGAPTGGPAELRLAGGVEVLAWPGLDELGVDALVTTRAGGVSCGPYSSLNLGLHVGDEPGAVLENRRRAARALAATLDDLVVGAQVHGAATAIVTDEHAGRGARAAADALSDVDVLVTERCGLVLVTLVADCVPILLVDPAAGVLATVHAGWRGTAAGAVGAAVATMATLGARPERMTAGMGPAVTARRYVVGPDAAGAVAARLGNRVDGVLAPAGDERWFLDLPAANRRQLLDTGVPASAILETPFTTAGEAFFSHRAQAPCGRFGLLARLRAA